MKYLTMIYNWFAPFLENIAIASLVVLGIMGLITIYIWIEDFIDRLYL